MQIEVTKQNIEDYGLDELTGNTKEELLKRAAEAARSGYILSFKIPDRVNVERNVFDAYHSNVVDTQQVESERINPIEGEFVADSEVGVGTTHECNPDVNEMVNSEWECVECNATWYYTGPEDDGWVQLGEIESDD